MAKDHDVIIYMQNVQLEVVVPELHVWDFMKEFGNRFKIGDTEGGDNIKRVDDYYNHRNGWHVLVSVNKSKEQELREFIVAFSMKRGLSVRI